MILPDYWIEDAVRAARLIEIEPFVPEHMNPASYDVTLDKKIMVNANRAPMAVAMDLRNVEEAYLVPHVMELDRYVMRPGEFILACTQEVIGLGSGMAARVEGKSSLARVGLAVHVTGGFIDPGFRGQVTLEMVNLLHRPLVLHAGMRIAQVAFIPMAAEPKQTYSQTGHYQGQEGPTLSRYRIPHLCGAE